MTAIAETEAVRGTGPEVETGGTNNLNTTARGCTAPRRRERRTANREPRTANREPRTANRESRYVTESSRIPTSNPHDPHASGGVLRWWNPAGVVVRICGGSFD